MPKMKTHSSAKKRFRLTKSGKVKFKKAFMRHMQMNKPKSMKRKARKAGTMFKADGENVVKFLLPNSKRGKTKTVKRKEASNG